MDDNYIIQKSLDKENIFGITCFYSLNSYDGGFAKKISKTWINFCRIIYKTQPKDWFAVKTVSVFERKYEALAALQSVN